jgi:hypothetical protein
MCRDFDLFDSPDTSSKAMPWVIGPGAGNAKPPLGLYIHAIKTTANFQLHIYVRYAANNCDGVRVSTYGSSNCDMIYLNAYSAYIPTRGDVFFMQIHLVNYI